MARIKYEQLESNGTPCAISTLGGISNHDNVTVELSFDVCGVREKSLRVNIQKWKDSGEKGNNTVIVNYEEISANASLSKSCKS